MTTTHHAVRETDLPLPGRRQGKVRDIYEVPAAEGRPPAVLIIASDRISAFDVVLPDPVPGKGCELTRISTEWFRMVREQGIIKDHLLSRPEDVPGLDPPTTTVRRLRCRRRGHSRRVRGPTSPAPAGVQEQRAVCGIASPSAQQCQRLDEPIFTWPPRPSRDTTRTSTSIGPARSPDAT